MTLHMRAGQSTGRYGVVHFTQERSGDAQHRGIQ
jgi:hypothetical protein